MASQRSILADSRSNCSRPVSSRRMSNARPLSKPAITPGKKIGSDVAGKSKNSREQARDQTPIIGGKAKFLAGGVASGSDQVCVERLDLFDLENSCALLSGEDEIEKGMADTEVYSNNNSAKLLKNKTGEEGESTNILRVAESVPNNLASFQVPELEGIEQHKPEMENFVFLKSPLTMDEEVPDIVEKKTAVDGTENYGTKWFEKEKASDFSFSMAENPQPEEIQPQGKLARILLSSASALATDCANQKVRAVPDMSHEEADVLEAAFQILTKQLLANTGSSPKEGRRNAMSTTTWFLLLLTLLFTVFFLGLKWNPGGGQCNIALPT